MTQLGAEGELMLVNPQRRAYVQVLAEPVFGRKLDVFVDEVVKSYQEGRNDVHAGLWAPKMGGFKLHQRGPLKRTDGLQGFELVFDLHVGPEELTFVEQQGGPLQVEAGVKSKNPIQAFTRGARVRCLDRLGPTELFRA